MHLFDEAVQDTFHVEGSSARVLAVERLIPLIKRLAAAAALSLSRLPL